MRQIDFKTQAGTKDKEEHNDKASSPKRKYNVHKYLLNIGASKNIKEVLTDIKGEIDSVQQ